MMTVVVVVVVFQRAAAGGGAALLGLGDEARRGRRRAAQLPGIHGANTLAPPALPIVCMHAIPLTCPSVCPSVQKETVPLYKKQILQLRSQLTAATGARPCIASILT